MPRTLTFEYALTPAGLQRNCRLTLDAHGRILAIDTQATGPQVPGLALAGMPNAHSHAFQRAIVGRGEGRGQDSFWSWRTVMYRVANAIEPQDLYTIALRAFADMLRGGFTSVGEFHYVHHLRDGTRTAEMALAVRQAARDVGIRIVMLPVLYQRGGFGREALIEQQRFVHADLASFQRLLESLRDQPCGIAPHSLRAVPLEVLPEVVALADEVLGANAPLHIHVSEQQREVDECVATHGRPPIQCLAETVQLGSRWSLVHATHPLPVELAILKRTDPNLVLCPLTEAYLGDGLFPLEDFASGSFAIGSDSNIRIDAIEELRLAEYGQRLVHQRRSALGGEVDLGGSLWNRTAARGGRAIAQPVGALEVGCFADVAILDLNDSLFAGLPIENVMDAWITAGSAEQLASVYVGGERRVECGQLSQSRGLDDFAAVMRRIHG